MRHVQIFGPRFFRSVFFNQVKKVYKNKAYDEFRSELGLPDRGSPAFEGQHSRTLILALFSQSLCATSAGLAAANPGDRICFLRWPQRTRDAADVNCASSMKAKPQLFLALGVSAGMGGAGFLSRKHRRGQTLCRRAVLLIGDDRNRPNLSREPLPPGIVAVNYAPFEALLPRASCHGPSRRRRHNIARPARRNPHFDCAVRFRYHLDNAAHAKRLGCSRTLPRKKTGPPAWPRELDMLLDECPTMQTGPEESGKRLRA